VAVAAVVAVVVVVAANVIRRGRMTVADASDEDKIILLLE
jgi:hypothetical protein